MKSNIDKISRVGLMLFALLLGTQKIMAAAPKMTIQDDWKVKVAVGDTSAVFDIAPPEIIRVTDEKHDSLPVFNPKMPGYRRGVAPKMVRAQECSVAGATMTDTFVVKAAPEADAKRFVTGVDYQIDPWGTFGRLEGGAITDKMPVYVTYDYVPMRLDSVVLSNGRLSLLPGKPHVSLPEPPPLTNNMKRVANIWISGPMTKLGEANLYPVLLYPVLEAVYPEPSKPAVAVAAKLLPKSWKKLENGEKIRILAWGDSVTDANYLPNKDDRWQVQFVERLRKRFPKAEIELITEAWGGRNTTAYKNEPPGSPKNYKEKVLDLKPDLIVMEFVNDSWLKKPQLDEAYGKIRDEFHEIGAEWIILTPHYVRPDWMGLTSCRDCDDDPREYVKAVREFGTANNIAVADAAKRYGHLWREGIPYLTLMMNNINHPNAAGMKIFADALMELF